MRPTWNEYFFEVVNTVAQRATCERGKSGCVIVRDNAILTTGYVGSAPNQEHCDEAGHQFVEIQDLDQNLQKTGNPHRHCIRTIHAEMNAILQAAKTGISLENSELYCSMTPCINCAMAIIRVGIKKVYCLKKYHRGEQSIAMFKNAKIEIVHKTDDIMEYSNQVETI